MREHFGGRMWRHQSRSDVPRGRYHPEVRSKGISSNRKWSRKWVRKWDHRIRDKIARGFIKGWSSMSSKDRVRCGFTVRRHNFTTQRCKTVPPRPKTTPLSSKIVPPRPKITPLSRKIVLPSRKTASQISLTTYTGSPLGLQKSTCETGSDIRAEVSSEFASSIGNWRRQWRHQGEVTSKETSSFRKWARKWLHQLQITWRHPHWSLQFHSGFLPNNTKFQILNLNINHFNNSRIFRLSFACTIN